LCKYTPKTTEIALRKEEKLKGSQKKIHGWKKNRVAEQVCGFWGTGLDIVLAFWVRNLNFSYFLLKKLRI
jgi:hypothetical protein